MDHLVVCNASTLLLSATRAGDLSGGWFPITENAVKRIWHIYGSQGQMLALAFRKNSLKRTKLFPKKIETYQVVSSSIGSGSQLTIPCFRPRFHVQTLKIYELGFNQNYYTFTLTLLKKIVMYGKFP